MEGEVVEAFRSGMYKVLLENGQETLGYTAGKMRRYRIKILPGDKINIELSPYDLSRGRIVYRHRWQVAAAAHEARRRNTVCSYRSLSR